MRLSTIARRPAETGQFLPLFNIRAIEVTDGLEARFWDRVSRGDGCWNWTGRQREAYHAKKETA